MARKTPNYDAIIEAAELCFTNTGIVPMDKGYCVRDQENGRVTMCCLVTAAYIAYHPGEQVFSFDVREWMKEHYRLTPGEFDALMGGFDDEQGMGCVGTHLTAYEAGKLAREKFLGGAEREVS